MKKQIKAVSLMTFLIITAQIFSGCTNTGNNPSSNTTAADKTTANKTDNSSSESTKEPVSSTATEPILKNYKLSNPNADENAVKLYNYICEQYGRVMISCQQESTWKGSPDYEMDYIEETTGKLPAMRGLDFMNGDFNGVVQRSKEWHDKGGIVTICWHTGVNGKGYQESKDDNPDFDKLLTEGTDEYNNMMSNWDKAAKALQKLRDAGVPVIWRPFHEFDGQWFWWGKGGGETFKKLWILMYDKFTKEYNLTNLIWILGYTASVKDGWYPGDEYCDIIGSDAYNNDTNARAMLMLESVTDAPKPLAYHECGLLPPIQDFIDREAIWSWFMVWHTDHIINNDKANLKDFYNSDKVITLDELPWYNAENAGTAAAA